MSAYKFAIPRSRGAPAAEAVQPVQIVGPAVTDVNGLVVLASIARIAFSDQDVEELVATLSGGTLDISTPQDRLDLLTNSVVIGPKLRQFFGWLANVQENVVVVVSGGAGSTQSLTPGMTAVLVDAAAGSITLQLPSAAAMAGRTLMIKKIDAIRNNVIIQGSETIDGEPSIIINRQYEAFQLLSSGSAWYIV